MNNLNRLSAWVDDQTKSSFSQSAKHNETSESGLLKLIINAFLKNNLKSHDKAEPLQTDLKTEKVSIRLTPGGNTLLSSLAQQRGMKRSAYLAALFRAQATQQPYFPEAELNALREANQQLSAIGRNINQIARALNTSLDNAAIAQGVEYHAMSTLIEQQRHFIKGLISANLSSWNVKND